MKRAASAIAASVIVLSLWQASSRPAVAGEHRLDGRTFRLPDGFTIEQVAGPPLVDRPIVADFDERGRLYVADSSGSNENVQKQLAERPHRIVRLEDTDGDGRFDKRTVFADRMMFPEGAMWHAGSLYVSAPPSIWKLTDTDGDGIADERVEWFKGMTLTGCANDLHGPYLGPDGRIYWCKGAFARQTYERPGKPPFVTRAAHIFRARPDGTGIEPVMTGGMDNPVDVVFTPDGERIFTTTFLQHPGGGRRDGLIHAIYGGVYGKIQDAIDDHKRTSPDVMPVLSHLGPAAPAGLTRYESSVFGADFKDNLFACQFNLRQVSRHVLTPSGSTYASKDLEFLSSPDLDFHPTDVIEDADGSLLVVDTGGWYKLCCPTSQLAKPDVLGAIYRIRKAGPLQAQDPRGLALDWDRTTVDDLAARLGDHRPAVRKRAMAALATRGDEAVRVLGTLVTNGGTPNLRRDAVWTLARIKGNAARRAAWPALADLDESVRRVAAHSASVTLDREAMPGLVALLGAKPDATRRVAAEALGRIGDRSAVPPLLDALAGPVDRVLEHSLTFALIEIADPTATAAGLARSEPTVRRAALFALDQMEGGGLKPERVAAELSSGDRRMRESAAWVLGRHPEWSGTLAGVLRDRLRSTALAGADRVELEGQLARFAKSGTVQDLLASTLKDAGAPVEARRSALDSIAEAGLKEVPASWADALIGVLSEADLELIQRAIATTRVIAIKGEKAEELGRRLVDVARRSNLPIGVRLEALAAVPGGLKAVPPELFDLLRGELDPARPVALRLYAAEAISRSKLSAKQLRDLADIVANAGPLEVDRLLAAFEAGTDEAAGLRLIAGLERSPSIGSIRIDMIRPRIAKYGPEVQRRAESLYARLNVDLAKQKAHLEELVTTLPEGEVRRGQAVFNGSKAACLTCHAVGYVGGKVGPDLTSIGKIRADRDLIEAIVFPSASFVRSYEPVVVATKDGRTISGLVRKESSDEIILATAADREERVSRSDVEEIRPGTVSVMPAGLDQGLSRQELADLIAFLKSRK
jgi:putative membrane-bound dehydrogenase-like protein